MTQVPSFSLSTPTVTGNKNVTDDLTKYLYSGNPTLNVSGTSQQRTVTLNLTNVSAVNFQGGIGSAIIQSASLSVTATYIFIHSGGSAGHVVNLSLDNGGLIAGGSAYQLLSGTPLRVVWDGTNLHT